LFEYRLSSFGHEPFAIAQIIDKIHDWRMV
jgi:hypothetical protein